MKQKIIDRLEKQDVLILDGAMGSNLVQRGLPLGVISEQWLLEQPEKVLELQSDFVAAGSDILLTCTFVANPISLAKHGLAEKMTEIQIKAVEVARQAFEKKDGIVAGSIGPCGEMLAPYGTLSEEDLYASTSAQAKSLLDAGAELIVIETQFDLNEAKTCVKAVRDISADVFLVVSFSYDRGRKTMMGVSPTQMAETFNALDVDALGVNCGKSIPENIENLRELAAQTDKLLWFKPNAGLPVAEADGSSIYIVEEAEYKAWMQEAKAMGVSFIGGCCGTSPEFLSYITEAVQAS